MYICSLKQSVMEENINKRNSQIRVSRMDRVLERFGIKTHKVMLMDAFVGADFPVKAVKRMMFGVGFMSDVVLMLKESVHLDNHKGNDLLMKRYMDAVNNFHKHSDKGNYIRAGVCLHTIGDFYALTNYIDLYSQYAMEHGLSLALMDLHTFAEMKDNPDFMAFATSKGELRAGTYGLISDLIEKIFKTKPKPGSHTVMNLDSNKSINGGKPFAPGANYTKHEAAVRGAYEDCRDLLQRIM